MVGDHHVPTESSPRLFSSSSSSMVVPPVLCITPINAPTKQVNDATNMSEFFSPCESSPSLLLVLLWLLLLLLLLLMSPLPWLSMCAICSY
jgi:hypothetical protein